MQDVNVYIKTTARGPAKRKNIYFVYVIQMKTPQKEYIKRATGELTDMTENQAELSVLIKALERFNRGCRIRIFTECEHVLHSINNGWPYQWEKDGWVKRRGLPVANAELWQQVLNLTKMHVVTYMDGTHEFTSWMEFELNRMKERNQ
jgi:ribonuclease HI